MPPSCGPGAGHGRGWHGFRPPSPHPLQSLGLLTELDPASRAAPAAALRPIVARLLDWFGPDRLIWGSDWPVLTLAASLADWHALTDDLLAGLSAAERAAILGGTAALLSGGAAIARPRARLRAGRRKDRVSFLAIVLTLQIKSFTITT